MTTVTSAATPQAAAKITKRLAAYSVGLRYEDLPAATVEKTKQAILDLLGIAVRSTIEGGSTPVVRKVVDALGGPGPGTAWGIGTGYLPQYAALMNGTYAHTLDFDDTHEGGSIHPGAPVIPAAFAIGDEVHASGRRLLAAIVAGYDVTVRMSEAAGGGAMYDRGFHPTPVTGTFGATAAIANVTGGSAELLENAFGINGSQASGSLQFLDNGAWNKRIHTGLAAHNAILAYRFAAAGALGASEPIEGRYGFLTGYTNKARPEVVVNSLGERYAIDEIGFKPYPSCRYSHAALDELVPLLKELNAAPADVQKLKIGLPRAGVNLIGVPEEQKRAAKSIVDGQFSMYFLAAVAILRGRFAWDDYSLLGDPEVAKIVERIEVVLDPEIEAKFPTMGSSLELTVGGKTVRRVNMTPKGEPDMPLSWDELTAKFNSLAGSVYSPQQCAKIAETVRGLDRVADVGEVSRLLGAPSK